MNPIKLPGESALDQAIATLRDDKHIVICGDDEELQYLMEQVDQADGFKSSTDKISKFKIGYIFF